MYPCSSPKSKARNYPPNWLYSPNSRPRFEVGARHTTWTMTPQNLTPDQLPKPAIPKPAKSPRPKRPRIKRSSVPPSTARLNEYPTRWTKTLTPKICRVRGGVPCRSNAVSADGHRNGPRWRTMIVPDGTLLVSFTSSIPLIRKPLIRTIPRRCTVHHQTAIYNLLERVEVYVNCVRIERLK